jgi:hypothetical protein
LSSIAWQGHEELILLPRGLVKERRLAKAVGMQQQLVRATDFFLL